jgi:hypothetical protein
MLDEGDTSLMVSMKSLSGFVAVFAVCSTLAFAEEPPEKRLYLVKADGKWGYIDAEGEIVIKPQFDFAREFSEGLALVILNKTWSFIDTTGKVVFHAPCRADIHSFSGGFGRGSIGLGFHYFDRKGDLLPHRFAATRPFSQGRAAVCIDPTRFIPGEKEPWADHGRWGFIDETGTLVIAADYLSVGDFAEGLAPVYVGGKSGGDTPNHGGKAAYINRQGKIVIEPKFYSGHPFSDGLAVVEVNHGSEDEPAIWTGYIDTKGEYVIQPRKLYHATGFHDGMAEIRTYGKMEREFINHRGETVFERRVGGVQFSEGLAAADENPTWDKDKREWIQGRKGYLDKTGKWVIEPQFYWAEPFTGGLARVGSPEEGQGYINKSGKRVFWWK